MKTLKKTVALFILLIGVFSFSKVENSTPKASLNLEGINVIEILSNQENGCRPLTDLMFYVETKTVKKVRGFSTINARVYVLSRASGRYNLLANENILVSSHKEAVIQYGIVSNINKKTVLSNGDILLGRNAYAPYSFNELMKYEVISNSYNKATNKLLKMNRTF